MNDLERALERVTENEGFRAEVLRDVASALREFDLTEEERLLVLEEAQMLAGEIQPELVEEEEKPPTGRRAPT